MRMPQHKRMAATVESVLEEIEVSKRRFLLMVSEVVSS